MLPGTTERGLIICGSTMGLWSTPTSNAALLSLLAMRQSPVDSGEVKAMSFYPPFKTFNARGERNFSLEGATICSGTLTVLCCFAC